MCIMYGTYDLKWDEGLSPPYYPILSKVWGFIRDYLLPSKGIEIYPTIMDPENRTKKRGRLSFKAWENVGTFQRNSR